MKITQQWEFLTPPDLTLNTAAADLAGKQLNGTLEAAFTTRCYLDSADYLLHRAGLTLEHDRSQQLFTLRERSSQRTVSAAAGTIGTDPWRPHIPAGELHAKVSDVLGGRAAIVQLELKLQIEQLSLEDANGKTRVRVYQELSSDGPQLSRVRIEPLRGFEEDAKSVRKRLQKLGAKACENGWLKSRNSQAMAQAVWKPSKLNPDIPAAEALARVLDESFKLMLFNIEGLRRDVDIEFLHDFRIAARRTRSVFADAQYRISKQDRREWRKVFKTISVHTSRLRDLDVLLLHLEQLHSQIDSDDEATLAAFRDHVEANRYDEHARLCAWLNGEDFAELPERWSQFIVRLRARKTVDNYTVAQMASVSIAKLYRELRQQAAAINRDSPLTSLHELRKTGKHLRYMIEAFASLARDSQRKAVLRRLKRTQDQLGGICDRDVQASSFSAYALECRKRGETEQAQLLENLAHEHQKPEANDWKRLIKQLQELNSKPFRKQIKALINT